MSPIHLSEEVREAQKARQALVGLESTLIAHGLPYPTNLGVARRMEEIIRQHGAVPATIAVISGQLRVGLLDAELEFLANSRSIRKVSRRDLPVVVAQGADGATTVAATSTIAGWAGVEVMATGGIGGVHREPPCDVSSDLPTLASVPVAVVCSGAKSILDLRATLEWLETAGVPVLGFGTHEFPAFYSRRSGLEVNARVDTPDKVADIILAGRSMGLPGGILVAVPVPAAEEVPTEQMEAVIASALTEARSRGIQGSAMTPFLLRWIARQTNGASIRANRALLENNAAVAAEIAIALGRRHAI